MNRGLLLVAISIAPSLAFAQQGAGWFIDGTIGEMRANLGNTTGFAIDRRDTTFSIGGGYFFNDYIGAEIGYRDLGEVSGTATATFTNTRVLGSTVNGTGSLTMRGAATGVYFGPVVRLPINQKFSLNARAGWLRSSTDLNASASFAGTINGTAVTAGGSAARTVKDTDPYVGIGATYHIDKNLGLGVDYTRYKIGVVDTKLDVWSARFTYRF